MFTRKPTRTGKLYKEEMQTNRQDQGQCLKEAN